jgi:hypothetical protein
MLFIWIVTNTYYLITVKEISPNEAVARGYIFSLVWPVSVAVYLFILAVIKLPIVLANVYKEYRDLE